MKKKILELINNKWLRTILGYSLFVFFIVAFCLYLNNKPDVLKPLASVGIIAVVCLFLLYFVFLLSNLFLTKVTIDHLKKQIPMYELSLLTAYSTLVNFFGPLQSGPGYRAIYLKTKHGIKFKDFTLISIIYYVAFGLISTLMLLSKTSLIYFVLPAFIIFILVIGKTKKSLFGFSAVLILRVFLVTFTQLLIVFLIYYLELIATGARPSLSSALSYAGSANLALFVAFTPGAIGIRESFIILSQSLHQIPTEQILAASILDRSIYFLFLMVLFAMSSTLHIKKKLSSQTFVK